MVFLMEIQGGKNVQKFKMGDVTVFELCDAKV